MQRIACAAGGEEDGLAFLPGANPAGRRRDLLGERWATAGERQGTLSPAPLLKGLRPLRIPLWRRILCAAEGGMGLRFYLGQIPPEGGGICWGERWATAGKRQGTLSPAPLLKGLRPLRIPLLRRILCAAEGGMGLRFYLGQIPPEGGGICWFLWNCRMRRLVE